MASWWVEHLPILYNPVLYKLYLEQKAIITVGFSASADVKAILQLGAAGFIPPYSSAELGQTVKEAFKS